MTNLYRIMKSNEEVLEELKKLYPQKEYHVTLVTDGCNIMASTYKSTPELCREWAKRMAFRWSKYDNEAKNFKARLYHMVDGRHNFMYTMPIEL